MRRELGGDWLVGNPDLTGFKTCQAFLREEMVCCLGVNPISNVSKVFEAIT
jgi:hypothetical protein